MLKRKKVDWLTIVLSDTQAGGSEHQQIQLFRHLLSENKKCLVVCLSNKSVGAWKFMEKDARVIYFPFSAKYLKINYLLLYPYLVGLLLTNKIQFTFSTQTLINASLGFFKRIGFLKNCKVIVRESNSIFELLQGAKLKRYSFGYKLGYSGVDLVICQTLHMKNQLIEALPWLNEKVKVCVIDNPIDLEFISERTQEQVHGVPYKPFLVAAGSLHPKKGFDILIDVFASMVEEFPKLTLVILGEGSERPTLEKRIHSLGLGEKIILKGFVKDVYTYFKNAEVCVISSRIEGFPNVLLQMMSQNTKVVSTISAGGIEDIPGIYTAPVENILLLKKAIASALSQNTDNNREVFDSYLKKRGVGTFVLNIMEELKGK